MEDTLNLVKVSVNEAFKPFCTFIEPLKNYENKEGLLIFFIFLVLLVQATHKGLKTWLKINVLISIVLGSIWICCPQTLLSIIVKKRQRC